MQSIQLASVQASLDTLPVTQRVGKPRPTMAPKGVGV